MAPSVFAFLLSFCVVLVTWVNHHGLMKLVRGASGVFVYANGFLLLTVVFTPFPTALIGEYLLTDHAAPAVVLYNAVLALQAVAWFMLSRTAIRGGLARNERSKDQIRENGRLAVMAFGLYGLCSIVALWIPLVIAIFTTLTWFFWLVQGARMKQHDARGRN